MSRKRFFYLIDAVLPRWTALLPYKLCLNFIKLSIQRSCGQGIQVWNRNSTRLNYFIMGVSDLDVTILISGDVDFAVLNGRLRQTKKLFPFLGETNLYHADHLPRILSRANAFELKRDPELKACGAQAHPEDDIEKLVFLSRMLFSDVQTLMAESETRQKKWSHHARILGLEGVLPLKIDDIKQIIQRLFPGSEHIQQSMVDWISAITNSTYEEFKSNFGEGFRIIAPHKHIWGANPEFELSFLTGLSSLEKKIIKRQIDWEIWGIYTQRFWLDKTAIKLHLDRLSWVYSVISSDSEVRQLHEDINLVLIN